MWETRVRALGREDPLEKEMATHSSILAWRIPWTEEPGRLQSTGSQSQTRLSDFTFTFTENIVFGSSFYGSKTKGSMFLCIYRIIHVCVYIRVCVYVYTTYTHMRKHTYKSFFKTNNLKKSINRGRYMEEPGRLQSMGSLRVRHDWETSLSLFTFLHWRRKWQPTPVFLPGESQGHGSLVGCRLWRCTESDTTEAT